MLISEFPEVFEITEHTVRTIVVYATTISFSKTWKTKKKLLKQYLNHLSNVGVSEKQV